MAGKTRKPKLSVALFPLGLGGSNAPRLELEAIFAPPYNAARYGFTLTGSPAQADIVVLYGCGTNRTAEHVARLLATLPEEVKLVALGSETISAQPFRRGYAVSGPLEAAGPESKSKLLLPYGRALDATIPGSPPDPQSIIDVILKLCQD